MAIANANLSNLPAGASALSKGGNQAPSLAEPMFIGTATFTGDGAASAGTVNWIDGTDVLTAIPGAVVAVRNGGSAALTVSVASVSSITAKDALITFSAVPANTLTVVVAIAAYR